MTAVLSLDPYTIDPDEAGRIGLFYPEKMEAIGILIAEHGQKTPISVVRNPEGAQFAWKLVAGLHRLKACTLAGVDVLAIEENMLRGDAEFVQASENLHRRELEPIERAMFIRAMVDIVRAKVLKEYGVDSQQQLAGKARAARVQYSDAEKADEASEAASDNLSRAYGWNDQVSEASGFGKRDIQRSMRIYRCIVEENRDLMDAFKDLDVAKSADALLKIAALKDAALRRKVIETLISGPKDLGYVFEMLGITPAKVEASTYAKFSSQILGGLSRLGTAEKRRFIPELAAAIPVGMRALVREELDRLDAEGGAA
ncbi:ParB N-terminal domain-containing protein [Nostoc sp. CHAB 5834]|nr:ParB N-terminal domain-containing protein [Nostoc sp. CHAB 5834]